MALALTLGTTACSARKGPVAVELPAPGPATQRACAALAFRLPQSLGDDLSRRATKPESPLVAAWGSPPAVLRCGVPIEPTFKTGDQTIQITREGAKVGWFAVQRGAHVVWSTPLATVHVELTVPDKYQGATLLAALTPAVSELRVL